jgi:MFS transporter, AAHS family, 4-hydroxybenzoate transporter
MAVTAKIIEIRSFINGRKLSRYQFLIFGLCFLVMAVDGYDTVVVGYIAPALRAAWTLSAGELAPLFGAGLAGLALGSLALGPLADLVGRRVVIIVSVAFFGALSLASAFAPSLSALVILRLLTGLGLGSAMPNAYTIAAEYCPDDKRSLLVASIGCGIPLGGAFGGLIAAPVLGIGGWPAMLLLGGGVPLVLALVLWRYLPESVRYLVTSGRDGAAVAAALQPIAGADLTGAVFIVGEPRLPGLPVRQLFAGPLLVGTLCLWITAFNCLLLVFFFSNWLTTLVVIGGASQRAGSLATAAYLTGATAGTPLLGYLMDRFNPHYVLGAAASCAGAGLIAAGAAGDSPILFVMALFVAGTGTGGTMTGANILSASFYPTTSRATGVSWTLTLGRVGSIVGAVSGGALLAAQWGMPLLFSALAIPAFIAAVGISAMGVFRVARGASMEGAVR